MFKQCLNKLRPYFKKMSEVLFSSAINNYGLSLKSFFIVSWREGIIKTEENYLCFCQVLTIIKRLTEHFKFIYINFHIIYS